MRGLWRKPVKVASSAKLDVTGRRQRKPGQLPPLPAAAQPGFIPPRTCRCELLARHGIKSTGRSPQQLAQKLVCAFRKTASVQIKTVLRGGAASRNGAGMIWRKEDELAHQQLDGRRGPMVSAGASAKLDDVRSCRCGLAPPAHGLGNQPRPAAVILQARR